MELKEAGLIFGRIQARYPNWSGSLTETSLAATRGEWIQCLHEEFDQLPGEWVMGQVLAACKANPGNFPPGIDVLCTFVRKAKQEEYRKQRQDHDHQQLADDREKRKPGESPAEFHAMTMKLVEETAEAMNPHPYNTVEEMWSGLKNKSQEPKEEITDTIPLNEFDEWIERQ